MVQMVASTPVITPAIRTVRTAHQPQTPEVVAAQPVTDVIQRLVIILMSAVVRKPARLLIRTAIVITVIPV